MERNIGLLLRCNKYIYFTYSPKNYTKWWKGGGEEGERKKLSLIGKVFKLGIDFACIIDKIPH